MNTTDWTDWPAPAKLNLFLHIVGRRADGYHLLQTYFQLLDWGDSVRLRLRADGLIQRVQPLFAVPETLDLSLRAAHALKDATGTDYGVDIGIDKQIPMGGGLGGGSSNAATVLVALNQLWRTHLPEDDLAALGMRLGADVPVFIRGYSAFAEGIGEVLTPLAIPDRYYLIVDPGVHVPTHELFQSTQLTRDAQPVTISSFSSGVETRNAFEPVVQERFPAVKVALDWLKNYGEPRLSGTGGCVFLPLNSQEEGEALIADCLPNLRAWVVRGVYSSPLRKILVH